MQVNIENTKATSKDLTKLWDDIQGHLLKEMKGPSFQTWIKPTRLISVDEQKARVAVKNEFNKNFLK